MKDIFKIRRRIEKDLIKRLLKNNRKLDFQRLWYQFSQRSLSKGIDKEMYRAYLRQKVQEGKLTYYELEDSYSLVVSIKKDNFRSKSIGKDYWNELSKLISVFTLNHKKFHEYFLLETEVRQKYFQNMIQLKSENEGILKSIANISLESNFNLKLLERRLPKNAFRDLQFYRDNLIDDRNSSSN